MLGKRTSYMQNNQTGPLSYTINKINSKWIKDLNIRPVLSNIFLDLSPQIRETKAKLNKRDYIKGIQQQMKRQPTEWEKIFAKDVSNKELISKIYKEHIQLNIKKPQKFGRGPEQKTYQWPTST